MTKEEKATALSGFKEAKISLATIVHRHERPAEYRYRDYKERYFNNGITTIQYAAVDVVMCPNCNARYVHYKSMFCQCCCISFSL